MNEPGTTVSYLVERYVGGDKWLEEENGFISTNILEIGNLQPNTTYEFRIIAVSEQNVKSIPSKIVMAITDAGWGLYNIHCIQFIEL